MNSLKSGQTVEILLVEDNHGDVLLAREGFRHAGRRVNIHHVENGEKCLAFLRKEGAYAGAPTPNLILLDINMPGMSGHEVLANMVADPSLSRLPVVALSTSGSDDDIQKMYSLRCNSYIVKPADLDGTLKTFKVLCDYWFEVAALPSNRI